MASEKLQNIIRELNQQGSMRFLDGDIIPCKVIKLSEPILKVESHSRGSRRR